jgi:chondroitin 4-sulfotransferase 11
LNGNTQNERIKVIKWYTLYGKKIIAKYRKTTPTDTKYKKAPTFREFIEYLVDLPITEFESHWIPMYLQCMPCHIQYSIIARLDTLTVDSDQIFKSMAVSAQLPRSHVTQGRTTDNTVATYYSQISKDLLDKLYNIYKFDFLLFNYNGVEYQDYVKS